MNLVSCGNEIKRNSGIRIAHKWVVMIYKRLFGKLVEYDPEN